MCYVMYYVMCYVMYYVKWRFHYNLTIILIFCGMISLFFPCLFIWCPGGNPVSPVHRLWFDFFDWTRTVASLTSTFLPEIKCKDGATNSPDRPSVKFVHLPSIIDPLSSCLATSASALSSKVTNPNPFEPRSLKIISTSETVPNF